LRAARIAAAVGLAAGGLACADFPDVTTVVDLRVLAVATEPSEVILQVTRDPADPKWFVADPASNPSIAVTPLLADPPVGLGTVTWTLDACPNNAYGAAPPGNLGGAMLGGGARSTVGSNLCGPDRPLWHLVTDPVPAGVSRAVSFTDDQLTAAAMTDFYLDQFGNPHGGLDLGLPMNLQLTVTDGIRTAVTVKRVLYWYTGPDLYWKGPLAPDQTPNQAPYIPEVCTYPARDPVTADPAGAVTVLEAGVPQALSVRDTLWIQPSRDCGAAPPVQLAGIAEPYWTAVVDPDTHMAVPLRVDKERIRYAFYASAGKFDPPRTASELPAGFTGTVHLEAKYIPPATVPLDAAGNAVPVRIWIITRDERGGESWVVRQLALEP
jgi:hypothetical protein